MSDTDSREAGQMIQNTLVLCPRFQHNFLQDNIWLWSKIFHNTMKQTSNKRSKGEKWQGSCGRN